MTTLLECDSLGFLSVDGLYRAMGEDGRNHAHPQFADHYFTGDYPTPLTDREEAEAHSNGDGHQLSLLASTN
jgi:amidophosphoribosyltransferase